MSTNEAMKELQEVNRSARVARRITAAARDLREEYYPRVTDVWPFCVEFHRGDRRFELSPETALYVELYLQEQAGGISLSAALKDENHVRELIEVIAS